MDYDFHFLVSVCLGDGSAAENGYFGDGGRDEHLLEDGGADEACGAGENEMHCISGCECVRD